MYQFNSIQTWKQQFNNKQFNDATQQNMAPAEASRDSSDSDHFLILTMAFKALNFRALTPGPWKSKYVPEGDIHWKIF